MLKAVAMAGNQNLLMAAFVLMLDAVAMSGGQYLLTVVGVGYYCCMSEAVGQSWNSKGSRMFLLGGFSGVWMLLGCNRRS